MYYSTVTILGILILLIENKDILTNRNGAFDFPSWKVYRKFLFAVLLYYVFDFGWGIFEEQKLTKLLFFDTTFYFIATAVGVYFWTQYVVTYLDEKNGFGRFVLFGGQVISVLIVVLTLANIFVPILFTVGDNCEYIVMAPRYYVLLVQVILLVLLSVYALSSIIRRRYTKEVGMRFRTIALFGIIMAAFLILQMIYPLYPMYTIAYLLGTALLHAFVIGDEEEANRLELKEASKIAELKQSISALLDNMPALSFSKDAETGVYMACNQAFAEYAHKDSPEGVIGLTDAQIFDAETARHFVEDDRTTLSMDEPYIFFEDVPDAVGNQRQFQTTKLKFHDADGRLCTLGMCQDVTALIKQRRLEERLEEEKIAYARINALAGDLICLYVVVPETGRYREYSSKEGFKKFNIPKEGLDFFTTSREGVKKCIHPEDQDLFLAHFTKEHIMAKIEKNDIFALNYRLMIEGKPRYVQLKAAMVEEKEGKRLIVGINDIDVLIRQEEKYQRRISKAQEKANIDALTGVKTKYAYVEEEERLNRRIKKKESPQFAVVIMDINNLKKINDTEGHQAGDAYIRNACKIICNTFKRSPVFRVGGDEFAVIAERDDYTQIDDLVANFDRHNAKALQNGGIVIACGMSKFAGDEEVSAVYARADKIMYENKSELKKFSND